MDLEGIVLREINQIEKTETYGLTYMWDLKPNQNKNKPSSWIQRTDW